MAKILNIDGAKLNIDSTNIKDNYVLQPKIQMVLDNTDLNNYTTVGAYRIRGNITNLPTNYQWGLMLVISGGGGNGIQLIFSVVGSPPAYRYWSSNGATFSDWFYLSQTT